MSILLDLRFIRFYARTLSKMVIVIS